MKLDKTAEEVLSEFERTQARLLRIWKVINIIVSSLFLGFLPVMVGWLFLGLLKYEARILLSPLTLLSWLALILIYYVVGAVVLAGIITAVVGAHTIIRTTSRQTRTKPRTH